MNCPECGNRANTKCSYKMCKECCTAHVLEGTGVACKTKVHAVSSFDCKLLGEESTFVIDTVGVMNSNPESDASFASDNSSDMTNMEFPTDGLNVTVEPAASDVMVLHFLALYIRLSLTMFTRHCQHCQLFPLLLMPSVTS